MKSILLAVLFLVPISVYAESTFAPGTHLDEISIGVKSEDLHEVEKENIELKQQIKDLKAENDELRSEISLLLNKISELEDKIDNLNQIIQEQIKVIMKHFK